MMDLLHRFFWEDSEVRRKVYAFVAVAGVVYGTIRTLVFHRPERRVTIEVVLLLFVSILIAAVFYCLRSAKLHREAVSYGLSPLLRYAGALACVVLLVTPRIPVSTVQAAIVDTRLRITTARLDAFQAANPPSQDKLRIDLRRFQSIADTSFRYQIPVDASAVEKSSWKLWSAVNQPQISESTKQEGWAAYGKLSGLAATQATLSFTKPIQPSFGYPINSVLDLTDKKLRLVGEHSALTFGGGEILIQKSTVVFDGIDLRALQPYYPALYVLDSSSSVVVQNGTIENLDQTLDGITWINVQFQHSMIRVRNGPFTLVNVSFQDCDLRWLLLSGQIGQELQERVEKANGQPMTFAYKPATHAPE